MLWMGLGGEVELEYRLNEVRARRAGYISHLVTWLAQSSIPSWVLARPGMAANQIIPIGAIV